LTNAAVPDSHIKFLYCQSNQSEQTRKQIFIPRSIPVKVDFTWIRDILGYCEAKHRNLCSDSQAVVPGMKLIDCYNLARTTPELDMHIVGSRCPPYVCLSYVWGEIDNDKPIPQVVQDAMTVTQELGYRYLWVDKYCIDQDDHSQRDLHISRMDAVYHAAQLTLIAATGKDADSGLAGVGNTPRIPQQSLTTGSFRLISSMHVPLETIKSCSWNTRAWTYQEGILPRRRLVFTSHEVYFECESMHLRESWEADLDKLHSHGRLRKFFYGGPFAGRPLRSGKVARSCFENLKRFDHLAREYSTKQFSRNFGDEDSIRAFQGITGFFKRSKYPVYELWGVPFTCSLKCPKQAPDSFVASLLWRHTTSVVSNKDKPERRAAFPSWSWAGWAGEVVFPRRHTPDNASFVSTVETLSLEPSQCPEEYRPLDLSSPHLVSKLDDAPFSQSRILKLTAPRLLPAQLKFKIAQTNDGWDTPNVVFGKSSFKAVIHLSGGNVRRMTFQYLFMSGKFDFVLLAVETIRTGRPRKPRLGFLILEPHGNHFCRVGSMVVKTELEAFEQEFTLESVEFRLS
jgi:hypothetical protein